MDKSKDPSADVFADILSVCAKVLHDVEQPNGQVFIDDLVELRDDINEVRKRIATSGYKEFPKIRKDA